MPDEGTMPVGDDAAETPPEPYQSLAARGWPTVVLLVGNIALALLGVATRVEQLTLVASPTTAAFGDLTASDRHVEIANALALPLGLVTAIAFLSWMYRAYSNLSVLGAEGLTYSPPRAVASFFIPVVNLVRPYRVMREIWLASDPRVAGEEPEQWRQRRGPLHLKLWWTFWLLRTPAAFVHFAVAKAHAVGESGSRPTLLALNGSYWIVAGLDVITALLLIAIILRICAWQDGRGWAAAETRPSEPRRRARRYALRSAVAMLIAGGIAAFVLSIRLEATPWKEFSPPRGEFTVQMPGSPSYEGHDDGPYHIETYRSHDGASIYSASSFEMSEEEERLDRKLVFAALKKAKVEKLQGNVAEESEVTVGAQPAAEFLLLSSQLAHIEGIRVRMVIVGRRVFQFIVLGDAVACHGPEAEKFFASVYIPGMWKAPPRPIPGTPERLQTL